MANLTHHLTEALALLRKTENSELILAIHADKELLNLRRVIVSYLKRQRKDLERIDRETEHTNGFQPTGKLHVIKLTDDRTEK